MRTIKIFNDNFYVGWYKNYGGMYRNPITAILSPFFKYWKYNWKNKIFKNGKINT